jgi:1,5-anhydro-D-fructose reductase (1,5-anhydro-D-mannitol-forming)
MNAINGIVNWGIIGCGDVCEVKSGPAFNKVANSRLVAVMRRDVVKAKDYADRHGVRKYYSDARELINDDEVNAIYIATPPSSHETYTISALKAGKPVYVEKPVTLDAPSCARMIAAAEKYDNKVSVAHYRRELQLFKTVKELMSRGVIGKVRLVELKTLQAPSSKFIVRTEENWRVNPEISGGGIFHDLAPHQLDIMFSLFGPPQDIKGFSVNQSKMYDAPDLTTMQARFNDSVVLNASWAFNVSQEAAEDKCVIIGDAGKLEFAFFKLGALQVHTNGRHQTIEMDYPANVQLPMINAVTQYFRGERDNPCSLQEAWQVMKMIDAVSGREKG